MKKIALLTSALCMASMSTFAATQLEIMTLDPTQPLEKIAPYPAAPEGFIRQVIYLPQLKNENDAKVELLIGKTMEVDCNRHMLGGSLTENTLEGWGYTYFVVTDLTGPASTMMACMPDTKTEQFITIPSTGLERYNSKLPIVVFTPKDVQVKYRVWTASEKINTAIEK